MTTTPLNIAFQYKDYAKMCGASWDARIKKWTISNDDYDVFMNSYNYLIEHKTFDENEFIMVSKRFEKKLKYYQFKVEIKRKRRGSYNSFSFDLSDDDDDVCTFMALRKFINKNDIKHYYEYLDIKHYEITYIKKKYYKYSNENSLFFKIGSNYYKRYKSFDKVYKYTIHDYIEHKISTAEIKRIYNFIKNLGSGDVKRLNYCCMNHSFVGNFFKYILHLNLGYDPISQCTNINKDVANIIYDYV